MGGGVGEGQGEIDSPRPPQKRKKNCVSNCNRIIIIIIIKIKTETFRRYTYKFVQFWLIYIKEQVRKDEREGRKMSKKRERKLLFQW